ncbi:ceramidase [Neiella marina]|uniref:Ceramidase n=1 Tax=Neiella holothuriorum TaxID=2870530 RepID=A0ABS7EJ55_9GAMM|nr:ceramidase domain-containing protein [Neiella holothuriorum]MBW8192388.1 ceramidase [Neiella holothuriorum]
MDLFAQYDNYCERTDFSFWSEPLNAMTNGGFILVGLIAIYLLWRRSELGSAKLLHCLAWVMIAIGTGSFLFHTLATHWAMLADIYPIYLFQIIFLWAYPRRALSLTRWQTTLFFIAYAAVTVASGHLPVTLNGSEMYLPTIVTLLLFSGAYRARHGQFDRYLASAAGLFALSLTMRTIDNTTCDVLPIGTHFLWHTFNALVLFLCWYSLYWHQYRSGNLTR